ncbi:hypothetical protein EVAR_85239_1 [Eumeta japonica]|uniref:Uncharacterized protein n=1 Tax=Eumeta variegata TaxID=151549 RepID=A0A4C1W200_EUMVA|nr:hypothetical protein EVAR_85239_1 [Eumeta japonica]
MAIVKKRLSAVKRPMRTVLVMRYPVLSPEEYSVSEDIGVYPPEVEFEFEPAPSGFSGDCPNHCATIASSRRE